MAKVNTLPITQTINFGSGNWTSSDSGGTAKTIYTAGAEGSVVKTLSAMSTETSTARVLDILINDGSGDRWVGAVNVPVNSGFTGLVAATDLLSGTLFPGLPYDANGKRVLPLKATHVLKVRNQTAPTSGKELTVVAIAEDY